MITYFSGMFDGGVYLHRNHLDCGCTEGRLRKGGGPVVDQLLSIVRLYTPHTPPKSNTDKQKLQTLSNLKTNKERSET